LQIIDDHLALMALEGRRILEWGDEVPFVPWLSHARLVRALMNSTVAGSLSGEAFEGAVTPVIGRWRYDRRSTAGSRWSLQTLIAVATVLGITAADVTAEVVLRPGQDMMKAMASNLTAFIRDLREGEA